MERTRFLLHLPSDKDVQGGTACVSDSPVQLLLWQLYRERSELIRHRLEEFAAVGADPEATFYELCYCLCTPGTKARHALALLEQLRYRDFFTHPLSATELEQLLRSPSAYIRFHRHKAQRLARVHSVFERVWNIRHSSLPPSEQRWELVQTVSGFGMKEASHFLRNTGVKGIAVLDRHVLRWMERLGCPVLPPQNRRSYEAAEHAFIALAHRLAIPPEELDLLCWSLETGEVLR